MKLFLTGATGVLGRKTVELLLKDQHEVHALVRNKNKAKELKELGVNPVIGNIFDKEFMLENTKGFEGFINLVTSVPKKFNTKPKDFKDHIKLRVDATKLLVFIVATNKIPFILQTSSLLSYGHHAGRVVDESIRLKYPVSTYSELSDDYLAILESSTRCEYILNHVYNSSLPRIILRLGILYGPESFHTNEFLEQVEKNVFPIINKGKSYLNLLYIDDAARAILLSVNNYKKLLKQTFNISDDKPVTNEELVRFVATKLSAKPPKDVVPKLGNALVGKFETNIILSSFKSKNDKFKIMTGWKPHYETYKEGFESILKKNH